LPARVNLASSSRPRGATWRTDSVSSGARPRVHCGDEPLGVSAGVLPFISTLSSVATAGMDTTPDRRSGRSGRVPLLRPRRPTRRSLAKRWPCDSSRTGRSCREMSLASKRSPSHVGTSPRSGSSSGSGKRAKVFFAPIFASPLGASTRGLLVAPRGFALAEWAHRDAASGRDLPAKAASPARHRCQASPSSG
jgi:hypothetical protein